VNTYANGHHLHLEIDSEGVRKLKME
jgi:hypothetical protein